MAHGPNRRKGKAQAAATLAHVSPVAPAVLALEHQAARIMAAPGVTKEEIDASLVCMDAIHNAMKAAQAIANTIAAVEECLAERA